MSDKKPMPGNKRTQKSIQKRKNAGMIQIKVWVADETGAKLPPDQKTEADKIRTYAAKQPKTKTILTELKK